MAATITTVAYPQTLDLIKDFITIREAVFVHEQGFPVEGEADGKDPTSVHFILYVEGNAVGGVRLIVLEDYTKLGRLAVLKEHRGKGYGKLLVKELVNYAKQHQSDKKLKVESQVQVVDFYESLGFTTVSEVVIIEDYPHKRMEYDFNAQAN